MGSDDGEPPDPATATTTTTTTVRRGAATALGLGFSYFGFIFFGFLFLHAGDITTLHVKIRFSRAGRLPTRKNSDFYRHFVQMVGRSTHENHFDRTEKSFLCWCLPYDMFPTTSIVFIPHSSILSNSGGRTATTGPRQDCNVSGGPKRGLQRLRWASQGSATTVASGPRVGDGGGRPATRPTDRAVADLGAA